MAPLPSRKTLEAMKRVELQNLCKEYGVRANLKTEALIDLLLETQSAPPPTPMRRSVSTVRQSSRPGPSRTSSLIIHNIEEEGEPETHMGTIDEGPESVPQESQFEVQPQPPIRTRKAKDLQTRLGVGRPKAAGGSGPRAVTKSSSVPRGRRGKSSRMMNRMEATIEEEAEGSSNGPTRMQSEQPASEAALPSQPSVSLHLPSKTQQADISEQIANAVRPLEVKVERLEEELRSAQLLNRDLEQIRVQLANLETLQQRYDVLEAEVRELRTEAASITSLSEDFRLFKENMDANTSTPPALPSTPKPKSPRIALPGGLGSGFPSAYKGMGFPPSMEISSPTDAVRGESASKLPLPGPSSTMLGKRPRSSSADTAEEGQEESLTDEELARTALRHPKKRAKLSSSEDRASVPGASKPSTLEVAAQLLAPRLPSFTIFQGHETDYTTPYLDDAPPTNHLPEVYRPPTPPGGSFLPAPRTGHGRTTNSASNEENQQHPFDFSFLSNAHNYPEPIPFPDPPQSPSPASNSLGGFLNQAQEGRTDPFREFGFPSPKRPRLVSSTEDSSSRQASTSITSNEIAAGLGLTKVRTGSPGYPEAPPSKRTMYGTELDGETRFGDFGVEGVASGFWSAR